MTRAETTSAEVAGALPQRGVICPYLGLRGDRSTAAHAVDGAHTCYHPERPTLIHPQIQESFCLAGRYARCPVYREVVERPTGPPRRLLSLDWVRGSSGRFLTMFVFVVAIPALLGGVLAIVVDDDPLVLPTGVTRPPSSDVAERGPIRGTAGGPAAAATAPTPPGTDTSAARDGTAAREVETPPSGDPLVRLRDWPTLLTVDVALGDSLLGLAGDFSTSVEAIQLLNGLVEDDQIIEGQQLLIPLGFGDPLTATDVALGLPAAEESDADPVAEESLSAAELLAMWPNVIDVVVEDGDTPGRIARRYDTTSEAVIAYNGLADAASLFLGATVTIPIGFTLSLEPGAIVDGEEDGSESTAGEGSDVGGAERFDSDALAALLAWDNVMEWTVRSGDSLAAIAREYDTTIEAVAAYNDILVDESIFIGQTLDVPVGFQLSLAAPGG